MIDIRDSDAVLARLDDVQRRFEKGGPVPLAVGELLAEIADALAATGPLELGVSSSEWAGALAASRGGEEAEETSQALGRVTAERTIDELRVFFGHIAAAQPAPGGAASSAEGCGGCVFGGLFAAYLSMILLGAAEEHQLLGAVAVMSTFAALIGCLQFFRARFKRHGLTDASARSCEIADQLDPPLELPTHRSDAHKEQTDPGGELGSAGVALDTGVIATSSPAPDVAP